RIHNGHIYVNGYLYEPKPITKLAITYFGTDYRRNQASFERFSQTLLDTMGELNIVVNHYECKRNPVENTMQKIDEYFHSTQALNYDFLVCIMNDGNSNDLTQLKHRIKLSGTVYYGK
ncbi:unnamed protein product, partial [Rotaria sp. Silwood1]